MSSPIIIDQIRPRAWRDALAAADQLDLEHGDLVEACGAAIHLWCSPESKLGDWPADVPISRGALSYPRAYVGTFSLDWGEHAT
jgi:hypothetical protein